MSEYIIYKTKTKERFDDIAYRLLGNTYKIQAIIEANPHIIINTHIEPNTEILIPLSALKTVLDSALPIWKRSADE